MKLTNPSQKQKIYDFLDSNKNIDEDFVKSISDEEMQHWQSFFCQKAVLNEAHIDQQSVRVDVAEKVIARIQNETSASAKLHSKNNQNPQLLFKLFYWLTSFLPSKVVFGSFVGVLVATLVIMNLLNEQENIDSLVNPKSTVATAIKNNQSKSQIEDSSLINDNTINANISDEFDKFYMMYANYNAFSSTTHQFAAYHKVLH